MTLTSPLTTHGQRTSAVRLLLAAVASVCIALTGTRVAAATDPIASPEVSVREDRGTYRVMARFEVPQPPDVVLAVLADYEQIPRFMPDIRRSIVLERTTGRQVVEQEAVSKYMMFSKRVHLLLEVTQDDHTLRFVDRCGKSFKRYAGAWRAERTGQGTTVTYELSAEPAFNVPEFLLKRLLTRQSSEMIGRLRTEFAARAEAAVRAAGSQRLTLPRVASRSGR